MTGLGDQVTVGRDAVVWTIMDLIRVPDTKMGGPWIKRFDVRLFRADEPQMQKIVNIDRVVRADVEHEHTQVLSGDEYHCGRCGMVFTGDAVGTTVEGWGQTETVVAPTGQTERVAAIDPVEAAHSVFEDLVAEAAASREVARQATANADAASLALLRAQCRQTIRIEDAGGGRRTHFQCVAERGHAGSCVEGRKS